MNLLQAMKLGFFSANNFYESIPFFLNILHCIPMLMSHINDLLLPMDNDTDEICSVKNPTHSKICLSYIPTWEKEQCIWAITVWNF